MPTDESYLDNLLKGLTSDTGSKTEDDRLSSYRKRRNGEIKDSYEPKEIPGFLNSYIDDDKRLQFHVVPNQEDIDPGFGDLDDSGKNSYFDDDNDRDSEDFSQTADEKIENYDIFEDNVDDSLIDEMIASELSEDENPGEPFGVPEEPKGTEDTEDDVPTEAEPETSMDEPEEQSEEEHDSKAAHQDDEAFRVTENGGSDDMQDSEEPEAASDTYTDAGTDTSENDALSSVFGNMAGPAEEDNSAGTTASAGEEKLSDADKGELDSLLDAEDSDTPEDDNSNVEIIESSQEKPEESGEKPADEWVVDNTVEEIPQEETSAEEAAADEGGSDDLADIFSGGGEETPAGAENQSSEPKSLEDLGNIEGLSSEDISSLDGLFNELEDETEEGKAKKAEAKKEKLPLFLRIFGNVPIPPDKIKPEPTEEELAAKKAEAAEKKKAAKDEKKKAADEKKKAAAEAKAAKAKATAEEKAAAKEKKKEQMEKLLLEDTGNTQKLNLAGVIVVFAMFAAIAALIISSINTASYNASVKEAESKFNKALEEQNPDYYTEAYYELLGLDIKDKDKLLEDKIYTVNFVNEDITAFNNHYAIGDLENKVKALRDLLDGLMTYNFYIDHAYELEIQDHLLYLRSILIGLLDSEYGISEDEAVRVIHDYEDQKSKLGDHIAKVNFTEYIYNVVENLAAEEE